MGYSVVPPPPPSKNFPIKLKLRGICLGLGDKLPASKLPPGQILFFFKSQINAGSKSRMLVLDADFIFVDFCAIAQKIVAMVGALAVQVGHPVVLSGHWENESHGLGLAALYSGTT